MSEENFKERVLKSLGWAVAQSWGGKLLAFIIFLILVRLVTPAELGVVAAALLVMLLLNTIAMFGFDEALIQRSDLTDDDINLPFFVSIAASTCLGIGVFFSAGLIEHLMEVPGLAPVVQAIAFLMPINTAEMFQEALYRRHTKFKQLAMRTLSATALSGVVACGMAFSGYGVWALVVQAFLQQGISLVWLWMCPVWMPSRSYVFSKFKKLSHFGAAVVSTRMLDYIATRGIDFVVAIFLGPFALGLYAAGTKLYQTLMYLLQNILSQVALPFLSKVSHDKEHIRNLYLKTAIAASFVTSPMFVLCAVLSSEISDVLFSGKWGNIDQIIQPFFLLGSLQCIQFLNDPYYKALGRPVYLVYFNFIKIAAIAVFCVFCYDEDIVTFVRCFCLAQLITIIPSFYFLCRLLKLNIWTLFVQLIPFFLSSFFGAMVVIWSYDFLVVLSLHAFFRGIMLGVIFVLTYLGCVSLIAREKALSLILFFKRKPY